MRKENSTFHINYLSQPGVQVLHNNDYFGCTELDEFACYVVADGMLSGNHKKADPSARLAVEAVITAFQEHPSIGKGALSRYLDAAHRVLKKEKVKASVTVVVTNYEAVRYSFAGNCRFQLYRGGKVFKESGDHSLSWDLMKAGQIQKDKIAMHEERNNLHTYCGILKSFHPTVSRKLKLQNADVFSLVTRGIWENARNIDLISALQAAENDPAEATQNVERLILDHIPPDGSAENYTICFVFVDKVYLDVEKKKRRKKIIIICVVIVLLVAILVFLLLWNRQRKNNLSNDMYLAYHNGIEYIQGENFPRAKEELDTAYEVAQKLKDNKHKTEINNHLLLVDAVIYADDLRDAGDYEQAVDAYNAASNRSRFADNLAESYVQKNRDKSTGYMNVKEYIALGDNLMDVKDFDNAEKKYLAARSLASKLYYMDGKNEANDSLQALYGAKESSLQEQQAQAQEEVAAAEFIIEGDNMLRKGDLVAATLFYQLARDKYEQMGNTTIVGSIDQKLKLLDSKAAENRDQEEYAAGYLREGDRLVARGEYLEAKRFYLLARQIYANLNDEVRLNEVQEKMDLADLYIAVAADSATP